MIDLGEELEFYDGGEPKADQFHVADLHNMRMLKNQSVRLADLQREGFNRTPPPGFPGAVSQSDIDRLINWPNPFLPEK